MSDLPAPALRAPTRRPALRRLTSAVTANPSWAGVTGVTATLAMLLGVELSAWPPHEDEVLALFVGDQPLGRLLHTVLHDRGGAPLHFLVAWAVVHSGGGLATLRLASVVFALASVPVIFALVRRLTDSATALATMALASASWVLLFHGVYARMYSLFLLTSALSYLGLVRALESGRRRDWALWGVCALATVATHPYGALVVTTQAVFVAIRRVRLRQAAPAFALFALAGSPFWYADVVLARRFEVGVGGGGETLGSPGSVLSYLGRVAGDFSAGWSALLVAALAAAGLGLVRLAREHTAAGVLAAVVLGLPAVAFSLARLGHSSSPESRHLIFALPFFSMLLATGLLDVGRRLGGARVAAAVILVALAAELAWAAHKTPELFRGDAAARSAARRASADWLAATGRADDVLFGYEPVFLVAWEHARRFGGPVVPRADGRLAVEALRSARHPLGRAVFVLDAGDSTNLRARPAIPFRLPRPAARWEGRAFGPYLVIRTRRPTRTVRGFLEAAERAMQLGRTLEIGDAPVNLQAIAEARRLDG